MSELGGTSTQAGIFYQNSVAALVLLDLLELTPKAARERVIDVRVEAPSHVDDIVVHFADGHYQYWNVKLNISPTGHAWKNLWRALHNQWNTVEFSVEDKLVIVFGEQTAHTKALFELCERASSSMNKAEFETRLTQTQSQLYSNIALLIGINEATLELLRIITVRHLSEDEIKSEFNRRRLGGGFVLPGRALSTLRDIVGSGARRRGYFLAPQLRHTLQYEHSIEVSEPPEWGLPTYRAIIARTAKIEIPGTGIFGSASELFVWPRAKTDDRERVSDFEDENQVSGFDFDPNSVDLQTFPSSELAKAIIVAGPGHGKSALLTAISAKLSNSPYVPISIPLASFGASDLSIIEFLSSSIEREMGLKADWPRLAEQGLLVLLFDGLDEVPPSMRSVLLNRISIFSARYPSVPWVLTVRDPAALSGSNEAPIVELLPLDDDDIVRFVDAMSSKLKLDEGWKFLNKLKLYPDLEKLARIPLFLSMLLATMDLDKVDAFTRSDLIEAYLKTLFVPAQHKITLERQDRSLGLRVISEKLAFDRLEKHEIGASEKEVRDAIRPVVQDLEEGQVFFEQLLANGILKQQSSIRYQFPYPIVQEYLAACHLVSEFPDSLPKRIDDAIRRPWAQVIQFALELHPNPSPAIKGILKRDDDAFITGLRLVGRCISNGAKVDSKLASEVGDRLVDFWIGAPSRSRKRVGRLLLDGYISPPSNKLKAALHHRWLNSSGGGSIISKIDDAELTLSVFKDLLENDEGFFRYYNDMQPALNSVGNRAIQLIIDLIKSPDIASDKKDDVLSILGNFSSNFVNRELVLTIAMNEELSDQSRMRAFKLAGAPLDPHAQPLIDAAMLADDWHKHYGVCDLIGLLPECERFLCGIFEDSEITKKRKLQIAEQLPFIIRDRKLRENASEFCLENPKLDPEVVMVLKLFEARFGNRVFFTELLDGIQTNSLEYVGATISLFGHYREKELVECAVAAIETRDLTPAEVAQLAQEAVTGMHYVFEMGTFRCGALQSALPHPGIAYWVALLEDWCDRNDLEHLDQLRVVMSGSRLGSMRCTRQLESILTSITDFDDDRWDDDEHRNSNALSNALHELRRSKPIISDMLIDRLLISEKYNVASHGVSALEAQGNRAALEKLILFHSKREEWHLCDMVANAIEALSAKLSLPVEVDGNSYRFSRHGSV